MDAAAAAVFSDPDTYAMCLLALGIDRFGRPGRPDESPINWVLQTWDDEVRELTGSGIHPRNRDRLGAACTLLTNPDEYYTSARGFGDITQGLAAEWFEPDVWHPPTTSECLWSVVESYLLDPPEPGAAPRPRFSPEVSAYVTRLVREDGFPRLPRPFAAFGVPEDPDAPPFDGYESEPELAAATAEGLKARTDDLSGWLSDRLTDLASRLRGLPLKSGRGPAVAGEILQSLTGAARPG